MNNFLSLSPKDRISVFEQIRLKTGLIEQAIEKDWWVTQTLALIFNMDCASHLVFKGGTSLSKSWGLIERFSEDIDLAIDRKFLGFGDNLSKTQVGKLRKESYNYISTTFFNQLKNKFEEAGFENLTI
jgi:predicted nucleotidyltransferase component of viral defense system